MDYKRSDGYNYTAYHGTHTSLSALTCSPLKGPQARCLTLVHAQSLVRYLSCSHAFKLTQTRTIPLIILRLVYFHKAQRSSDTAATSFNFVLVTVIHTNVSVIASCLTFLKPMADSLDVGFMKNDIRVPLGSDDTNVGANRINPFSVSNGRVVNLTSNANRYNWDRNPADNFTATATAARDQEYQLQGLKQHGSQDRMVITQTKTTDVSSFPRFPEKTSRGIPSSGSAGESTNNNY